MPDRPPPSRSAPLPLPPLEAPTVKHEPERLLLEWLRTGVGPTPTIEPAPTNPPTSQPIELCDDDLLFDSVPPPG